MQGEISSFNPSGSVRDSRWTENESIEEEKLSKLIHCIANIVVAIRIRCNGDSEVDQSLDIGTRLGIFEDFKTEVCTVVEYSQYQ